MGNILKHNSGTSTKMLFMGESGTGKTGALYSLAEAGYSVRIIDYDNGGDILFNLARQGPPEVADRIYFETCTDKMKQLSGSAKMVPDGVPNGFNRSLSLMTNWKIAPKKDAKGNILDPGYDLGPVSSWGANDILVIDSLTHMGLTAFRMALSMNSRIGMDVQQKDWGDAQNLVEGVLAMLYSTQIKCNVLVLAHVSYLGGEEGDPLPLRGLPMSLGKALSPKIGTYFNTMLLAKIVGSGAAAKRVIMTVPDGVIALKNPSLGKLPAQLPLASGLATAFKILRESPRKEEAVAPLAAAVSDALPTGKALVVPAKAEPATT